ncbi:hypothetical protein LJN51_00200 [Cellulomonas sp. zg-B12]|nr:hypothetical protein [Cellulomonas xiejunii]
MLSAVGLAAVLALAGCDDAPERPEGAVELRENQPASVGDVRLVASNIWDDSAVLVVADGDGPADNAGVEVGERVTIKGHTFELVSIYEDTSDAPPGGSRSYAWVLPVDD